MTSQDKLFTLDDLLYYTKFATSLHCDETISTQILKSLAEDLKAQNIASKEALTAALVRNGINIGDIICGACGTTGGACGITKVNDILKQCPSCKCLIHENCFWKPNKFCNRECFLKSAKN